MTSPKSNEGQQSFKYPGIPEAMDGSEAVVWCETNASEAAGAYPITPSSQMGEGWALAMAGGRLFAEDLFRWLASAGRDVEDLDGDPVVYRWELKPESAATSEGGDYEAPIASLEGCGPAPGTLLLECVFLLQCRADTRLHVSRYLPPTPLRLLLVLGVGDDVRVVPSTLTKFVFAIGASPCFACVV